MIICSKCGTENESDMIFCQNCGDSLRSGAATPTANPIKDHWASNPRTPTAYTIEAWANIALVIVIIAGIIEITAGIVLAAVFETGWFFLIGLISGGLTIPFGFVSRAFVRGYGIIVGYCEKRR